jgi:hypothetical protein
MTTGTAFEWTPNGNAEVYSLTTPPFQMTAPGRGILDPFSPVRAIPSKRETARSGHWPNYGAAPEIAEARLERGPVRRNVERPRA